jgi:toxin ParE1/3/4
LVEHYVYLGEHADLQTAERFLANAHATFVDLSKNPERGAPLSLRSPRLAGLRKWRINAFEKFLVFYLPRPYGVSIVRVLHAAQDWWTILGMP